MNPWLVVIIGLGTVFAGLLMIILAIKIMTFFTGMRREDTRPDEKKNAEPQGVKSVPSVQSEGAFAPSMPHDRLVALTSAAIAEYIGGSTEGLRIVSLKQLSGARMDDDRVRNVAIAAAIAESLGTAPEGLRILSVKRI